ncbi:oligosaccharide flippase family protein [Vibrio astriarenae]
MSFVKNILRLASSSLFAKGLGFALMPIISRIYSAEEMGVYTSAMSLILVVGSLSNLRFCDGIPVVQSKYRAITLLVISLVLSAMLSGIITIPLIYVYFGSLESISNLLVIVIVFGCIIFSSYESLSQYAVRVGRFKELAKSQFSQALSSSIIKLSLGYMGLGSIGLVIGGAFNQGGGLIILLKGINIKTRNNLYYYTGVVKKSIIYPRYRLPSKLFLLVSQSIPIIYFSRLYSMEELGSLGLVVSTISAMSSLIVNNIRKVYYGKSAELFRKKHCIRKITTKTVVVMGLISLPFSSVLYLYSKEIFTIVFGQQWHLAGEYAKYYSIYVLSSFMAGTVIDYFNVVGKIRQYFYLNFVRLILIILSFSVAYFLLLDSLSSVVIYVSAIAAFNLLQLTVIFLSMRKS